MSYQDPLRFVQGSRLRVACTSPPFVVLAHPQSYQTLPRLAMEALLRQRRRRTKLKITSLWRDAYVVRCACEGNVEVASGGEWLRQVIVMKDLTDLLVTADRG